MAYKHLLVERDGAVALVTINRPDVLNALSQTTIGELGAAMAACEADVSVRAVVLTGAGSRAFVAGADIRELANLTASDARVFASTGQALLNRIACLGKPVIAAVNGVALGGGNELAMACTVRIAADTARFGQPEITLGLMPGFGGTQRLPRLVGVGRAYELLLSGAAIDAQEAWRIGLVNRVVPAAQLREAALDLARAWAGAAPVAVRQILAAVEQGADMPLRVGLTLEAGLFAETAATDDMHEGTRAFLEKRTPTFKGQ